MTVTLRATLPFFSPSNPRNGNLSIFAPRDAEKRGEGGEAIERRIGGKRLGRSATRVVVSKTRKAFVGPRKGRDAEYNGARVRPSCANDTVSPGLSRCRIVPANSFIPPPPPPPPFSPHCAAYVCVRVCVRAHELSLLLVSLRVTSTYAPIRE